MRFQSLFGTALLILALPSSLLAVSKTYNEAAVDKLDGTVMVQHADGTKTALQTGSTVEKGDILTAYDQSWVILKTHKGDRIGIEGSAVVAIDEYYIEGPDRQIRLLLQSGTLLLKTNGCGSRQSFFEINTGGVVTSINETQAIMGYASNIDHLKVQYFNGKLTVIDKDNEQKFKDEYVEHHWEGEKMVETESIPVDEMDKVNYNRFFDGDPLLEESGNNLLMTDRQIDKNIFQSDISESVWGIDGKSREAKKFLKEGLDEYRKGRYSAAKGLWEKALVIKPDYIPVRSSLRRLAVEHPEVK